MCLSDLLAPTANKLSCGKEFYNGVLESAVEPHSKALELLCKPLPSKSLKNTQLHWVLLVSK